MERRQIDEVSGRIGTARRHYDCTRTCVEGAYFMRNEEFSTWCRFLVRGKHYYVHIISPGPVWKPPRGIQMWLVQLSRLLRCMSPNVSGTLITSISAMLKQVWFTEVLQRQNLISTLLRSFGNNIQECYAERIRTEVCLCSNLASQIGFYLTLCNSVSVPAAFA